MSTIIADVIDRFGCYTAAYERQLIAERQKPAPPSAPDVAPSKPKGRKPDHRQCINATMLLASVFMAHPDWWTMPQVQRLYPDLHPDAIHAAIYNLVKNGRVERRWPKNPGGGTPQEYRWRAA